MHTFEFKNSFLRALLLSTLLLVANACNKSSKQFYVSPFADNKFQLSDKSFRPLANEADDQQTLPNLEIVVFANNSCIEERCSSQNTDRFSCRLYQHADKVDSLPTQFYPLVLADPISVERLEESINEDECVLGVSNLHRYKQSYTPNDPLYTSNQKAYLDTIRFEQGLDIFTPSKLDPVKVAVVDSGVAAGLPELPPSVLIWREDLRSAASKAHPNCVGKNGTATVPYNHHGTFVAGIIAAQQNNATGIAGIASNARILGFQIGTCEGEMQTAEVANAILAAGQQQAEVINLSLGGATADDIALRQAIGTSLNAHIVLVVSAGNSTLDLRDHLYYPASYATQFLGFITVGWSKWTGELQLGPGPNTGGSNYSPEHIKISAPGTNISSYGYAPSTPSGTLPNVVGVSSGSSFSAPMVSAAAALTIGFMKKHNLRYDEAMIEQLITDYGAQVHGPLAGKIRNSALLDLYKLGDALNSILNTGNTPAPITLSGLTMTNSGSDGRASATFTATWDLKATHQGARLGLFDSTCGYQAACLIQGYALTDNQGSKTFTLTRNELLPILPSSLSDPDLNVYVNVAVYYPRYVDGRLQNNYGVDANARLNIRDFDNSSASSVFTGQITNIRMDQRHLYVSGWTCLEKSNKAVPVELVNAAGSPIPSEYAYSYPYMIPHGTPIDNSWSAYTQLGRWDVSNYASLNQTGRSLYKSGLEASPLIMGTCKTLTASHGFDFAVPVSYIASQNLAGTVFKVRATNPNASGSTIILKDELDVSDFRFPEVNYQPSVSASVSLTRTGNNIGVAGNICSASPSPVNVEISYNMWAMRCSLKNQAGFPNFSEYCGLGEYNDLPILHDPSFTDRNDFVNYGPLYGAVKDFRFVKDLRLSEAELAAHLSLYPGLWPNATVSSYDWGVSAYYPSVLARGLKEVTTGQSLGEIVHRRVQIALEGTGLDLPMEAYAVDRADVSTQLSSVFWDYIDVGEEYTPGVVAYRLDVSKPVGDYIYRNYGNVQKLMREVKKYETPMSLWSRVLDHEVIRSGTKTTCGYRFNLNRTINSITNAHPELSSYMQAFLRVGQSPLTAVPVDDTLVSMRRVPLDIRFFQDGVMVLHLISNFGSQTTRIPTLGRGQ